MNDKSPARKTLPTSSVVAWTILCMALLVWFAAVMQQKLDQANESYVQDPPSAVACVDRVCLPTVDRNRHAGQEVAPWPDRRPYRLRTGSGEDGLSAP
jgi:hypothetical protein